MLRYVDETTASVWVETRETARVRVSTAGREWEAGTFSVHGHHYALVEVEGLEPGSSSPYTVVMDGQQVWPEEGSPFPAPTIRTLDPERPFRLAYGSCRTSEANDLAAHKTHGVDSLLALDLRNRLKRLTGRTVALATLLGGISGADLINDLETPHGNTDPIITLPVGSKLHGQWSLVVLPHRPR